MATWDVPGYGDAVRDELGMGCWAESPDGSLILVNDTEDGTGGERRVIFEVFDLSVMPPLSYRDAMPYDGFVKMFSWTTEDRKPRRVRWSWHNRTLFPWDRVIEAGMPNGTRFAMASGIMTAAQQIAISIGKAGQGREVTPADVQHRITTVAVAAGRAVAAKVQSAISRLRP